MSLSVKNEHFYFVYFDVFTQGRPFLFVAVVFLHHSCIFWCLPAVFFLLLNTQVIESQVMANVVWQWLMESRIVSIFWSGFIILHWRKVTLRMSYACCLVIKVRFILWSHWLHHWVFLVTHFTLNFLSLGIISVTLLVRHSWLHPNRSFDWWPWWFSFQIVVCGPHWLGPVFSHV